MIEPLDPFTEDETTTALVDASVEALRTLYDEAVAALNADPGDRTAALTVEHIGACLAALDEME